MRKMILIALLSLATLCGSALEIKNCNAGQLSSLVTDHSITELQISGTIDARDFRFIADSLRQLTRLDLSGATIAAYYGERLFGDATEYAAAAVPPMALADMRELVTLSLPMRATALGAGALAGCKALTTVQMPLCLSQIGPYALSGCSALTAVTVPQGLSHIDAGAFSNCTSLASFALVPAEPGDTITPRATALRVGRRAFANCPGLKSFSAGRLLSSLGDEALAETGLEQLDLSGHTTLDSLGAWSLANTQLNTVALPSRMTKIGDGAMMNDSRVSTLDLPSAMTYIGSYAMAYMTGLTELASPAVTVPALGDSVWYGVEQSSVRLKVSPSAQEAYSKAAQWRNFMLSSAIKGDVNGDGFVDIADINALINVMSGRKTPDDYGGRCYVNDDYTVDIADVNAVINIMLARLIAEREAAEAARRAAEAQQARPVTESPLPVANKMQ